MRYLLKITWKRISLLSKGSLDLKRRQFNEACSCFLTSKKTKEHWSPSKSLYYVQFSSDLPKGSSVKLQISNIVLWILNYIFWSGICFVIFTFFSPNLSQVTFYSFYIFPNMLLSHLWSYVGWRPSQISGPSVLLMVTKTPTSIWSSSSENHWITENVNFILKQLSILSDTSCKYSF